MAKRKSDLDKTPGKKELEEVAVSLSVWETLPLNPKWIKILAIDPGLSNAAFCYYKVGELPITSKLTFPKFSKTGPKICYIQDVVSSWIHHYTPEVVISEGPAFFAKFGVAESGGVQQAIARACYESNVPSIVIAPTSIRKYLGTSGKGKGKDDTKLEIYKKYGYEFNSTDESDSFAIAVTGLALIKSEFVITPKKPKKKVIND